MFVYLASEAGPEYASCPSPFYEIFTPLIVSFHTALP